MRDVEAENMLQQFVIYELASGFSVLDKQRSEYSRICDQTSVFTFAISVSREDYFAINTRKLMTNKN